MKYVLLFCGSDEDAVAFNAMTPEELRARYKQVGAWFAEHRTRIGATNQLQVADLDEALRMARTWPGRGTVEIRPVVTQR